MFDALSRITRVLGVRVREKRTTGYVQGNGSDGDGGAEGTRE